MVKFREIDVDGLDLGQQIADALTSDDVTEFTEDGDTTGFMVPVSVIEALAEGTELTAQDIIASFVRRR